MNSLKQNNRKIKGALAASLTAFNDDLSLDISKTLVHGKWLLDQGLDGVVFFGTTGEGNSLTVKEKKLFMDELHADSMTTEKVMLGTGSCSILDAVELSKHALEIGVKDCLVLPPFYYKNPSDDGLFAYFSELIQRLGSEDLRIQIYHFPAVSQIPISLPLISRLLKEYPTNITGIKDSGGDINNMLEMCKEFDDFDVYAGSETFFLPVLEAGGAGTITATGNITSKECVAVYNAFKSKSNDVKVLQDYLSAQRNLLQKACGSVGFASGLKEILSSMREDKKWRISRPPFVEIKEDQRKKILDIFHSNK